MTDFNPPTINAVVTLVAFLVIYLSILCRNAVRNSLDVYDFLMLSMVGILPSLFALLPSLGFRLSAIIGVSAPFLILFGFLFIVTFVFLYRLLLALKKHQGALTTLVQEVAFLREEMDRQLKIKLPAVKRSEKKSSR